MVVPEALFIYFAAINTFSFLIYGVDKLKAVKGGWRVSETTLLLLAAAGGSAKTTIRTIDSLSVLEPCGSGCPKPVLMMENLTIDRISLVGNGRHTRLRLRSGRQYLGAIYLWCAHLPRRR